MTISRARPGGLLAVGAFLTILLAVGGVWLVARDRGPAGSVPLGAPPATSTGLTSPSREPATSAPGGGHVTRPATPRPSLSASTAKGPPLATARATAIRFLSAVGGMRDLVATRARWRSDFVATVDVRTDSGAGPVSTVAPGRGPATFTVLGVTTADIVVDRPPFQIDPAYLEVVTSPMTVSGRPVALEGQVAVLVVEIRGGVTHTLGTGHVLGGGDVPRPFTDEVSFNAPASGTGWVLAFSRSAHDGHITEMTCVRLAFEPQPA